jgi:predicted nucleic acid-binding protein
VRKYVLDTNIYIHAARDEAMDLALGRFVAAFTPRLYLHSVVAFELMVGSQTAALRKIRHKAYVLPFERRGRVLTPSARAWMRAGEALGELVGSKKLSPGPGITRSLVNDCLIAASASEQGFTLVTENLKDFERLAPLLPIDFVAPWPRVFD